jgi:hypothetical protein
MSYSNFITPPDFVDESKHSVLIMDASWDDIETLAIWCQNVDTYFNVYVYEDIAGEEEWLMEVAKRVDSIIINSRAGSADACKHLLLKTDKVFYYGPKNYLRTDNRIETPIDYFIQFHDRQQDTTHSL